jgi:hypothetical protein
LLISVIGFFTFIPVSHISLAQTSQGYLSVNKKTVAPVGTDRSVIAAVPGKIQYNETRARQPKVEIDTPDVAFAFEFSQSNSSKGTVRAILSSNIDLKNPALEIAVDGDFTIDLSDKFKQISRKKSAYKSVSPQKSSIQENINATTSNSVVIDIPVTISGSRGVLSISLQDSDSRGEAASLFLLRDNDRIYAGVQGFMFLQEQALTDKLKKQGVSDDEIIQQIKKLRSQPGDVQIKIIPPAGSHVDTDPWNGIKYRRRLLNKPLSNATSPPIWMRLSKRFSLLTRPILWPGPWTRPLPRHRPIKHRYLLCCRHPATNPLNRPMTPPRPHPYSQARMLPLTGL